MRNLPYDISNYLCSDILQLDTLKSLSLCNKQMRDIAIPHLFDGVSIQGKWESAESGIECLHANPRLRECVR